MTTDSRIARRRALRSLAAATLLSGGAPGVSAQAWPSRPASLVVPFPPGGTTDVLARALGERLAEALALACGAIGRVRKARTLFLAGRTRIHLDEVEGLGAFLELEVVLDDDEPVERGVAEAHALMGRLGVGPEALVEGEYLDLLRARGAGRA